MNSAVLERGKGGRKKSEILSAFLGLAARFNNGRAVGWIARPDALLGALGPCELRDLGDACS